MNLIHIPVCNAGLASNLLIFVSYDACRNAYGCRIRRYFFKDDSIGRNLCVVTYFEGTEYFCAGSDHHIVA